MCRWIQWQGISNVARISLHNSAPYMIPGVIMALSNSLWHSNGETTKLLLRTQKQIAVVGVRNGWVVVGQRATQGQLITAYFTFLAQPSKCLTFRYQKTKISQMAISLDRKFFISVGSSDGLVQEVQVIEIDNQPQIGTRIHSYKQYKKSKGAIVAVHFSPIKQNFFLVLFANKVMFYALNRAEMEEMPTKVSRVRQYTCAVFSQTYCYCCSENGDIIQISLTEMKEKRVGPKRRVIMKGIHHILYVQTHQLLIGGKEGFLGIVDIDSFTIIKEIKLNEEIYQMTQIYDNTAYLSTAKCSIFQLNVEQLKTQLYYSSHSKRINQIKCLDNFGEVFVCCSGGQIAVWRTKAMRPQMKIFFPQIQCLALDLPRSGTRIISGWSDDAVRVLAPRDGTLLHKISNIRCDAVTSLLSIEQSSKLLAGGSNGTIWLHHLHQHRVLACYLFHRKTIHNLRLNPNNENQLVSCSEDGSYAIWNLPSNSLIFSSSVSNFVKDVLFLDQYLVQFFGAGSTLLTCLLSDASVKEKYQLSGSFVNCVIKYKVARTKSNIVFYGGERPYLHYFDEQYVGKGKKKENIDSFGEIVSIAQVGQCIVVGTYNGLLLKYAVTDIQEI